MTLSIRHHCQNSLLALATVPPTDWFANRSSEPIEALRLFTVVGSITRGTRRFQRLYAANGETTTPVTSLASHDLPQPASPPTPTTVDSRLRGRTPRQTEGGVRVMHKSHGPAKKAIHDIGGAN